MYRVALYTVLLKIDYTTEQLFLLSIKTDLKHKNRFPLNHLNVIFIQLLNISHILAIFFNFSACITLYQLIYTASIMEGFKH